MSGPLAKKTRDELSPYEQLVEELMRLLDQHRTQDDGQEGHPFYGNQYTNVAGMGAKPTTTKATKTKQQVHELLSSGHPFSLEELLKVTGQEDPKKLLTAIGNLKSEKKLSILKDKTTGHYFVAKPDGTAAGPAPATAPPAAAAAPTPAEPDIKLPGKEHKVSAEGITVPLVKMSKDMADQHYQKEVNQLCADLVGSFHADGLDAAAQMWKQGKAQAMAQWATNFSGELKKPGPVQVFQEDKDLVNKLVLLGMDEGISGAAYLEAQQKAISDWKSATAKAKQEAAKKASTPTPEGKAEEKTKAQPVKIPHAPDGPQAFKAPDTIVPEGHQHISAADFETGQGSYQNGISKLKNLLESKSKSTEGNKKSIADALDERLKESPHFQHLQQQWSKSHTKYNGSLTAQLISQWASSSGDHHDTSVSSQMAVMEAFGMHKDHVELKQLGALHAVNGDVDKLHKKAAKSLGFDVSTKQGLESYKNGMKDFALAQYHHTQAEFKKMGITHLHLVRGMNTGASGETNQDARKVKVKLQPASSFSTNHSTAAQFGSGGSLFMVKVPVEQVLGSYLTGFGCTSEHEVVVLAHKDLEAVQVGRAKAGTTANMVENVQQHLLKQAPAKGGGPTPSTASPSSSWATTTKPTYAEHGYNSSGSPKVKKAKELGEAGDLEGLKEYLGSSQLVGYNNATNYTQQWINHLEANPKKMAKKQAKAASAAEALSPKAGGPALPANLGTLAKKAQALGLAGDITGLMAHHAMVSQNTSLPKTTAYTKAWIEHLGGKAPG